MAYAGQGRGSAEFHLINLFSISCAINGFMSTCPYILWSYVLKSAIAGFSCNTAAYCIFRYCFACGGRFLLTCAIFLVYLHVSVCIKTIILLAVPGVFLNN